MTSHTAAPPAPPAATPPATSVRVSSPGRVAGAIAQLAIIGILGPVVLSLVFGLGLGLGIGLLPVLGIGAIFLVGFVYVLFALGWFENARIEGLYGFGLPPRRLRQSGRPGFVGWLRAVWLQAIDPGMWRGIANLAIASVLGWFVVFLFGALSSSIVLAFAPLFAASSTHIQLARLPIDVPLSWAVPVGIIIAVLSAAALIGLGVLHGVISRAVMVPSREAQLAEAARTSSAQREGAVRAADVERTRIERDLHDGVQPRLVSVGMTLGLAQQKIETDPEQAKELIAEAHASTKSAITELRQLARGIHTSVLDDRGLDAALSALAARSVIPVVLDVRIDGRCNRDTEAAMYFAIAESITNAAKHSRATEIRVVVRLREHTTLWARVEDNGVGGAVITPGGGLDGILNRIMAAGGEVRIDSPAGGPTAVEVSLPCAS